MKHDAFTVRLLNPQRQHLKQFQVTKTINKTKVAEVKEKPEEKKEPVAAADKTAPSRVVETPQQQQTRLYVAARRDLNNGRNQINACIMRNVLITMASYKAQKGHVFIQSLACWWLVV